MTPIDPGLYPLIDGCLIFQGLFLNLLWGILAVGWFRQLKRPPGQFQVAVAIGVWVLVLAACLFGFQPAHWLLGMAVANGAFLSVLDPTLAFCFTLGMLLMRPWEIMEPNAVVLLVPKFSTIFSFVWAFIYLWRIDRFGLRMNRVMVLLIGWLAWLFLSTFVTPDPADTQAALMATMIPPLTLVFLIYHLARTRFAIWALKQSLMVLFTCVGLISLYFFASGYRVTGRIVAFGMFTNSNDMAAVMTILLPLTFFGFRSAKGLLEHAFTAFATGVGLMVMMLSQSRGGVIAIAAGGAAYALRRVKNKALALGVIGVLGLSGMAATSLLFSRDQGDLGGSTENRSIFWISGIRMALFNPVFGVGYNQFPANVEEYATREAEEKGKRTAHSTWILALAESGPIGLALFLSFFYFGCLRPAAALYTKDPAWLYVGIMYATSISFLSHTYFMCIYLVTAIVMAAYLAEGGQSLAKGGQSRLPQAS